MNNTSWLDSASTAEKPRLEYSERAAALLRNTRKVTPVAPVTAMACATSNWQSNLPRPRPRAGQTFRRLAKR